MRAFAELFSPEVLAEGMSSSPPLPILYTLDTKSPDKIKIHITNSYQGSPPQNEVAGDKFIVRGYQSLVRLDKAVTFLFVHLELHVTSIFVT